MSSSMRQSVIGLMLLVSFLLLGGLILWIKNFSFGNRNYKVTIIFPNAGGMTPGTRVAYRGVKIGQVESVEPQAEGVFISVAMEADRLIPINSRIEATQAGLVGETSIDITPLQSLPPIKDIAKPLDSKCDSSIIICDGSILQGEGKLDVNTLIRSLVRISDIISNPETTTTIRSMIREVNNTLTGFNNILQIVEENGDLDELKTTLSSLNQAANEITSLLVEVRQKDSVNNLNSTLASIRGAAEEIKFFLVANEANLVKTLDSIAQTSEQLRLTTKSLTPVIQNIEQGELLNNLDIVSANAAKLTANLADFSTKIDDPQNILLLQQTLDSARSSFDNLHKITSDLDELTGNPEFRKDLENLIKGLSDLTSSTQLLEQQVGYHRDFQRLASKISKIELPDKSILNQ